MGKAFTCDRCGCLFVGNQESRFKLIRYDNTARKKTDLCVECRRSLNNWWNEGKKNEADIDNSTNICD